MNVLTGPSDRASIAKFTLAFQIVQLVAAHFRVSLGDLEGPDRHWTIVWPRFVAMTLLRAHTDLTLQKIGLLLNRHHAAVFNGLEKLQEHIETNAADAATFYALDEQVRSIAVRAGK